MHSSAASRIHPVDRAVALFGVGAAELAGRRIVVDGRRVSAIRSGRLALLLSYVDRDAYAPLELERRRLDQAWQANEARLHERAIERASVHGSIVPFRPLTIVPDAAELDGYAREHAGRWARGLARFGDKRECTVHLFAGPHASPFDAPYLVRVASRSVRSTRPPVIDATPDVVAYAGDLWRRATASARNVRRVDTKRRGSVFSAALLLTQDAVVQLVTLLEESAPAGAALGVAVYLEGPRAPFSFV